jgi:hypothetical protein
MVALGGKAMNITVIRNAIGTLEQLLSKASDALSQIEREVFNLYAFGRARGGYEYPREAMAGYLQEIHDLLLVVLEAGEMPDARASLVKAWAGFTSSKNGLCKTGDNDEFANSSSPALTFLERLIRGLRATVSEEISSEEAWTLGRLEEILEDTAALVRGRGEPPSKESDVQKVMHDYLRVKFSSSAKTTTACKWRESTSGNTAPSLVQEFGDTRSFVLPFVRKATSGYEIGTRPVL